MKHVGTCKVNQSKHAYRPTCWGCLTDRQMVDGKLHPLLIIKLHEV